MYLSVFPFLAGLGFFTLTVIKSEAEIASNIDVVFALVVGLVTIARVPFLGQALERFMFISKADSSRNTQFVNKFKSGLFLSIEWKSAFFFFNKRLHSLLIEL